eukprot:COSAG04_NODE_4529_length_2032_cov_3.078634_3_plen_301_part_00
MAAAAAPHINDLPEPALRRILLTAVRTDSLLRFVAACARVCAEWWRVVGGSAAYGRGLPTERTVVLPHGERGRVLKALSGALVKGGDTLDLLRIGIGDSGAAVLAAGLQAMPQIRFTTVDLDSNDVTAAGLASFAPVLRRPWGDGGLEELDMRFNPGLGDAGVATLAKALPPSLEVLSIRDTGCGDDGLVALAAALPALAHLRFLDCCDNLAATARGWVALARVLPSLPSLEMLWLSGSTGVRSEGVAALAAAVPDCPRLREIDAGNCSLAEGDKTKLRALRRPEDDPAGLLNVWLAGLE